MDVCAVGTPMVPCEKLLITDGRGEAVAWRWGPLTLMIF
jgi:hypothetical protein